MKKLQSLFLMLFLFMGINLNAEQVGIMTTGTNGASCAVNEIPGIKVGTSKANGDMFITLPANVTELTFYIAAWKGTKNKNVIITDSLTTDTIAVLNITPDDGISNNSPFTLNGEEETFSDTLQLTPQDSELVLKIESGTARRFVVWNPKYKVKDNGGISTRVSDLNVDNSVTKYIDNYGKLYIKRNNDVYSIYGSKIK